MTYLSFFFIFFFFHVFNYCEFSKKVFFGKTSQVERIGAVFDLSDKTQNFLKPRVYVYESLSEGCGALPPLPNHPSRWDHLEAYLIHAFHIYENRVSNPADADFFFVPLAATIKYHGSSFNHSETACHVRKVLDSVTQYKYAERSSWVDHVVPWAHDNFRNIIGDAGLEFLPWPFRHNAIFIVNQGDDGFLPAVRPDLMVRDFSPHSSIITLPPSWTVSLDMRPRWKERKYLAVFRGSLLSDPAYSNGVRQTLMTQFMQEPQHDFVFGDHNISYAEEMRQAKFCIFIKGWTVWSERLGTLINAGCVPVIISDHYSLPFSKNLDWSTFSLRLSMADAVIPGKLRSFLLNVSEERGIELENNLALIWHSLQYNLPPQPGDIFDRILQELSQRTPRVKSSSGVHFW